MRRTARQGLQAATHVGSLVPLALLAWDYWGGHLTVNPVQEITQRTGLDAILLLVLSLAVTPLHKLFGLKQLAPLRKPLGLYAFLYAVLHLLSFGVLDYGLDWAQIVQVVMEKAYLVAGVASFALLVPLALTSTRGTMRWLGQRWTTVHALVYLAAPLAVLHYLWSVKADYREPLVYGLVLAGLLVARLPVIRRTVHRLRKAIRPVQAEAKQPAGPPNEVAPH
ncbi:MAG: ferric reductase-like transmembrane domain-containing protein [Herpetosiphon sp.]